LFAAKILAALFAQDQFYRQITGRSMWGPSSVVPFAAPLGLGEDYGKYSHMPFIVQYAKNMADATASVDDLIKKGDYGPLLKFASRWMIPGGAFAGRAAAGAKAIKNEGWYPGNGKPGYPIDPSGFASYDPTKVTLPFAGQVDLPGELKIPVMPKKMQMLLFGPHATEEGQAHWRRR
jgi:hypothetical protein